MKTKTLMIGLALTLLTVPRTFAIEAMTLDPAAPAPNLVKAAPPDSAIPFPTAVTVVEKKTRAYKNYKRRPVSELSKLVYLGDLLKESGFMIVHNGMTYDPKVIAPMVRMYVQMKYRQETAKDFILKRGYRNGPSYDIIYLRDFEGKLIVLRDFLLEELKQI
jgi:hypothetical protein